MSTALGQKDFEGSFTDLKIWLVNSGYVVIFKSKMNYFMTNCEVIIKLLTFKCHDNIP